MQRRFGSWTISAGVGGIAAGVAISAALAIAPPPASWLPARAGAAIAPLTLDAARWARIAAAARAAVAAESPDAAFPFRPARPGRSEHLVVAHYFPVFPISIDGKPAAQDYYALGYLDPEGEGGKHRATGGFLRERPLPAPAHLPGLDRPLNLAIEVARADRIGIDAFGIDLLSLRGGVWDAARALLDAAQATAPAFRVIPEPDMGALGDVPVAAVADALGTFYRHPAAYRLRDGRLLVMPFAADYKPADWWQALIAAMQARGMPIAFVPVMLDPRPLPTLAPLAAAAGVWGDRYASGDGPNAANGRRARALGLADWFMPVAAQDYRPKDRLLMEARNSEALRRQWRSAIVTRARGAHLLTWNDYSESTQLAPSSFSQFVFYDLNAYHIAWFKRGSPPAITRDALYYVQRRQIVGSAPGQPPTVRGPTPLANDIEVVALLTAPGQIAIRTARGTATQAVGAGLQAVRVPAVAGRFGIALLRGGRTVIAADSAWPIDARPDRSDATYGGGSTTRAIVAVR